MDNTKIACNKTDECGGYRTIHCNKCNKCTSDAYVHCSLCNDCHDRNLKYCESCCNCFDSIYHKYCKHCEKCIIKKKDQTYREQDGSSYYDYYCKICKECKHYIYRKVDYYHITCIDCTKCFSSNDYKIHSRNNCI